MLVKSNRQYMVLLCYVLLNLKNANQGDSETICVGIKLPKTGWQQHASTIIIIIHTIIATGKTHIKYHKS